jgi:hypothetical protein
MKMCSKCKNEKSLDEFFNNKSTKDGKSNYCKNCHTLETKNRKYNYHYDRKNYSKEYYLKNKERLKPIRELWKQNNKQKQSELSKNWYEKNKIEKLKKNAINEKYQMIHNPIYRLTKNLRTRIPNALNGKIKYKGTIQLLGCTISQLKKYLEKQFTDKMNWENYGTYWHVDHIKPCSLFNLLNESEQMECFHYTNLQPLEAQENLKKYNKFNIGGNKNE